jgi:uncharacterized coiled-coil DUF342 family protein
MTLKNLEDQLEIINIEILDQNSYILGLEEDIREERDLLHELQREYDEIVDQINELREGGKI